MRRRQLPLGLLWATLWVALLCAAPSTSGRSSGPPGRSAPTGLPENVKDHGAVGDGVHDDLAAITAAVDAALSPGGSRVVVFPAGAFAVSGTVPASGSGGGPTFTPCSFRALGAASATVIAMLPRRGGDGGRAQRAPLRDGASWHDGSTARSASGGTQTAGADEGISGAPGAQPHTWPAPTGLTPIIEFRGGSGGLAQAHVRDLTLAGAAPGDGVTGVRFNSQDGVTVSGCVLVNLTVGAHFDNADAGGFTEFAQVVDSHFLQVQTGLLYTRGAGRESFHGSGMRRCTANWVGPTPFVWVASSSSIVYNAPWDAQVWIGVADPSTPVVFVIATSAPRGSFPASAEVYTHGTLTLEAGRHDTLHAGRPVYHAGFLEMFLDSNTLDRGRFHLVDSLGTNSDGSVNVVFKPHNGVAALGPAPTEVDLVACPGACAVAAEVVAPDYCFVRTLVVALDGYGGATVTEVASGRSLDARGAGPPVFNATGDGVLTVSNPRFPPGAQLYFTVTQLAQSLSQHDRGAVSPLPSLAGRERIGRGRGRW